ncbi:glycosyltransferase family 2 protein [Burkholderia pseudomallei]|uniref:glycosyltransferase family 2 protein n=1 Tax=Burkholderia pseudomallei TaxID=28450 RepID=UPI00059D623A|nr:glycosyltransferase [Burkholderia pseudomallei]OMR78683.1 glycosyl transferase family A [Burkholderia pseudomallei]OMS83672.1 glycosyl transferase family A [Burkholderia pseudomallei]OMU97360.1 glycosyl transferase family A [Burkholderia pseudomallei]OMV03125.1 glycosyl transferase family A [Burkholderia pseudomallei]OMW62733.1 glycosyl transferase family A [Burkholderia pseudomallei]
MRSAPNGGSRAVPRGVHGVDSGSIQFIGGFIVGHRAVARKNGRVSRLASKLLAQSPVVAVDAFPFVSVVCPTWQRRAFLPYLVYMFQYQDYPANRRELVILDDSAHSSQDLVEQLAAADPAGSVIRYYHVAERMTIGAKRNRLNELARGDYIVCMDDDDYYPPDKVSHAVRAMQERCATFSGSDRIYIWYSHIDRIYQTYSFGPHHALNGTFAYHRHYLADHRYDDTAVLAEESSFLGCFTASVLQIDPKRAILCVSHSANTFDKDFVLASCERAPFKLEDFVTDVRLLAHYRRLSHAPVSSRVEWRRFERIVINAGRDAGRLAAFHALLLELGVDERQIVEFRSASGDGADTQSHLDLAKLARANGWRNYLLLDDRLEFVRQEKAVANVNRFLRALDGFDWEVVLLGADVRSGVPLLTLPGAQRVNLAGEAVAYAVNQSYYASFIDHLERVLSVRGAGAQGAHERIDQAWLPLMASSRWLGLYPSFAYLSHREDGKDLIPGFFRKMRENADTPSGAPASFTPSRSIL